MDAELDTLVTALYVMTDDLLRAQPERVPARLKGCSRHGPVTRSC
ncbi:hypothetical protein BN11_2320004 [Nostocoides australiense Ben110]|uniref:Uncharacterized protein n=1 Tax=Nostocoides australiense Ben110 TaxID=1193182 RepID=W6K3E0_9MICO|nr:hypothetical protein BN11_2320004 [Tetrasphaera australiensis Ben110]